jgi:hypothetical protein
MKELEIASSKGKDEEYVITTPAKRQRLSPPKKP